MWGRVSSTGLKTALPYKKGGINGEREINPT